MQSNNQKVGLALCGYGGMGTIYADIIARLKDAELLYVVGRKKENVEAFCKNYNGAKAITDLKEALKDERVKGVIVASPNNTHNDFVMESLEAGKFVLCEKPLTLSSESTKKCFEKAKEKKVEVLTGFQRRFDASFATLKKKLDENLLGKAEIIKVTSRDPPPSSDPKLGEEPTPSMWDSLIHDFDMAIFLSGETKVEQVYASQPNKDTIVVVIKFESGTIAVVDWAKGISYGYDQRVEVHCPNGMLQVDNSPKSFLSISNSNGKLTDSLEPFYPKRYENAYKDQIKHFVKVITHQSKPLTTDSQVICGAEIAELALKSVAKSQNENFLKAEKPKIDSNLNCKPGKRVKGEVVNVALIGAGRMGAIRSDHMSKNKRIKLTWVVDVVEEMGKKLAAQYNAKFSKDITDALKDDKVDAVWISVSTPYHMKVIREATKHKKHIYCEKPISLSAEEVDEAFRLAKENDVMLICAWNRRFDPHFSKVHHILNDPKLEAGKPQTIVIHNGDHPLPPVKILVELGSIYHDFMVHDVDLAVWLANQFPSSLFATGTTFSDELKKANVLDSGAFVLTFPDGSVAVATARRASLHGYDQRLEVVTEKGCLVKADNVIPSSVVTAGLKENKEYGLSYGKINYSFPDRYNEAYGNEVANLAEVLIDGNAPRSTYEQCKLVALLTDAALKSSNEKKTILWN